MSIFSLTLLAPAALLGLLALAIPIYLHMRHKPRAESVRFSAIDFLLRAQRKRKRRFRVEQWLLMLFRILVIGLLAFLFAKPFLDQRFGEAGFQNQAPLAIVLDDSASMMAGSDSDRFFDRAVEEIRDLLGARAADSETRLLLASNPRALLDLRSSGALRDALSGLQPVTYAATLDEAYREALDLAAREGWRQAAVRIFTDGSQTAWGDLPGSRPEKVDVIYTSLRETAPNFRNMAITEVSQAPGDDNSIEVALLNSGSEPAEVDLRVSAPAGLDYSQKIRADGGAVVSHRFALDDQIPPRLTVELPPDSFALDNQTVFAPQSNKRARILIVDGDTHPESVRNESFFFRSALGAEESGRYGYELETITPAGLNAEKAERFDAVCLLNVDAPDTALLEKLLTDGKGVFISMGDRMDHERWNDFFSNYDLEMWEAQALSPPRPLNLEERLDHRLFAPIEEAAWRGYLENVAIERFRIMSLGRANFETPLKMIDGAPALLVRDLSPGRLAIWTSSMDLDWTNFPLEFGFVPFSRQLLGYLSGRDAETAYQSFTTTQVQELGIIDELNLKLTPAGFERIDARGPKPGIYTRLMGTQTQFVQVRLDPRELDFSAFASSGETAGSAPAIEDLGFRSFLRADLAPYVQWLLFLLILVETLVAARVTLNWGAR